MTLDDMLTLWNIPRGPGKPIMINGKLSGWQIICWDCKDSPAIIQTHDGPKCGDCALKSMRPGGSLVEAQK
jgi:hypothetical protein